VWLFSHHQAFQGLAASCQTVSVFAFSLRRIAGAIFVSHTIKMWRLPKSVTATRRSLMEQNYEGKHGAGIRSD